MPPRHETAAFALIAKASFQGQNNAIARGNRVENPQRGKDHESTERVADELQLIHTVAREPLAHNAI
ncbi:MAG: hypothetical protein Greene071436_39 [Parcubacteria group bacterium Greene0714_36]|nr:MAG: hypothetical protein Greene071436_39 [Parcubacteria group bacterium Greene0714_36]